MADHKLIAKKHRESARASAFAKKPNAVKPISNAVQTLINRGESHQRKIVSALRRHPPSALKIARIPATITDFKSLTETPIPATTPSALYPTPNWFRQVKNPEISVIVPMYKSSKVIVDLINSWVFDSNLVTELVFVDDCCPTGSKEAVVRAWATRTNLSTGRDIGKIVCTRENQGFGGACNAGAEFATGKFLVFLNADTCVQTGWLKPITDLLQNPSVGIVGNLQIKDGGEWSGTIDSAGSEWSWKSMCFVHIGRHSHRGKELSKPISINEAPTDITQSVEREMVTGCCLAIRSELFKDLGGFNRNYRIGYWEDADLCMCVRERGLKVMFQPDSVIFHKLSHTASGNHRYQDFNRNVFMNKWVNSQRIDILVKESRPSPSKVHGILLQRTGAYGDVMLAAATAPALKQKYPGCRIFFRTSCPEVLNGNPYIDQLVVDNQVSERHVQVFYNFDLAYEYRPYTNILRAFAEAVGVSVEKCKPTLKTERPLLNFPERYVVLHPGRTGWAGRDWKPQSFIEIANKLRARGLPVVLVGRDTSHPVPCDMDCRHRTNLEQLAWVIQQAKLFVGVDSFPMHIAQAFDVPGVCFFGSVRPELRLFSNKIHGVSLSELPCIGCHHRKPVPCVLTASCEIGTHACINDLSVDRFWSQIERVIAANDIV